MSKPLARSPRQYFAALRNLHLWFEKQRRILPWRDQPTVYRVWISEIMLQQTQVATVIPYFERFLKTFPSVKTLAAAHEDEVLRHWAGLGYYSRARNLHRTAKLLAEKGFPEDRDSWLELPGIGKYTAGAILSIALDQPEPILDGNVERVLSRVHRDSDKENLWTYARRFVETGHERRIRPRTLNQALMELGALLCTPRKPDCARCPLWEICSARKNGEQENYPEKRKKKPWLAVQEELHCVLRPEGCILLRRRGPGEWRAGLWDLLTENEIHSLFTRPGQRLGQVETRHIVTRHKITRTTYLWKLRRATNFPKRVLTEFKWVSVTQPEVALGSALRETLRKLQETFPEAWQ